MERFIEAVRKQPSLWNPQHPDYRDAHIKDAAWQRVIQEVNIRGIRNPPQAKVEWKKLRDNHRDALKRAKLGKNKLLPAQVTTWKYAKAMQFLEPHMKHRITEHIDMTELYVPEQDVSTTEDGSESQQAMKRRRVELTSSVNGNALESFFSCMLQSTKEMPLWMQTQVKKNIFSVIIEAEQQLNMQRHGDEALDEDLGVEVKTEIVTDDYSHHSQSSCSD
ncbi:hypothetical protein JYU34_011490 [Plutella xylostella]|uniref:Uncharacterized protein n=2 Tax=Plutella xylostella TaxID=51655 RepID=A0ABQ7QH38_PLUXY|nr:uncharacterized protein LOC105387693 [Plutella xylostella]KAG7304541.1 hypothetical protein JYU34_011490 [Plutella xylostella]CAG9108245.1 unnamed protein product [Plutella xylostella]